MLEIEGLISGPVVVIFSFFVFEYIRTAADLTTSVIMMPLLMIGRHILLGLVIGVVLAFMLYRFLINVKMTSELKALLIISVGIAVFVLGELLGANGTLAVAIYGLLLRGLTKQKMPKETTSTLAHILFIIVFMLFGIEFFFPAFGLWIKGLALFIVYLVLRFLCIFLF